MEFGMEILNRCTKYFSYIKILNYGDGKELSDCSSKFNLLRSVLLKLCKCSDYVCKLYILPASEIFDVKYA
jgi:hypothetical protein